MLRDVLITLMSEGNIQAISLKAYWVNIVNNNSNISQPWSSQSQCCAAANQLKSFRNSVIFQQLKCRLGWCYAAFISGKNIFYWALKVVTDNKTRMWGGRTFLMLLMVSFRDTGNLRKIPVGSRKSITIPWSPSFSHSSCIPYFPGGMVTASHLPSAPLLLTGTQASQRKHSRG